jgi:hypothetical protein
MVDEVDAGWGGKADESFAYHEAIKKALSSSLLRFSPRYFLSLQALQTSATVP